MTNIFFKNRFSYLHFLGQPSSRGSQHFRAGVKHQRSSRRALHGKTVRGPSWHGIARARMSAYTAPCGPAPPRTASHGTTRPHTGPRRPTRPSAARHDPAWRRAAPHGVAWRRMTPHGLAWARHRTASPGPRCPRAASPTALRRRRAVAVGVAVVAVAAAAAVVALKGTHWRRRAQRASLRIFIKVTTVRYHPSPPARHGA